jgi:salicylate hydroxylase
MAAALACGLAGHRVSLFERANAFSEVGAGVQIGPNVVCQLHQWGLSSALRAVAAFPHRLQARDARSAKELGSLALGESMQQRYGAPYATVHRADLHDLLHTAVVERTNVQLQLNRALCDFQQTPNTTRITWKETADSASTNQEGDVLIGADGVWSSVRQWLLHDGPPRATGHLAYRALVPQAQLPAALRSQQVTVWLGDKLHVVQYPVRRGEWLNVVAIVQAPWPSATDTLEQWDHSANTADLRARMAQSCPALQDLVQAIDAWRLWVLCDRPPMSGAHQHAQGRVALLGDAAHPMRPYLAQGAGMAIEDAAALADAISTYPLVPAGLQRYATERWQRNARVQARAERNGRLFHATGLMRWGRNRAMQLGGERLMDQPWLYGYTPPASPSLQTS